MTQSVAYSSPRPVRSRLLQSSPAFTDSNITSGAFRCCCTLHPFQLRAFVMHPVKCLDVTSRVKHRTPAQLGRHHQFARQQQRLLVSRATSSSSSSSSSPEFLPLGDGDAIRLPHERPDAGPRYEYSRDEAINIQLQALKYNDKPYFDHGIEVLYRYANFDPFQRSKYFGKSFDLGQFERFRRIMHIPAYKPLLNHEEVQTLSTLQLGERVWRTRLHVIGTYRKDEGVYEITMVQRLGGRYDGYWFTESLVADGNDWETHIISF